MNINLAQYRAHVGTFNQKYKLSTKKSTKYPTNEVFMKNNKILYILLLSYCLSSFCSFEYQRGKYRGKTNNMKISYNIFRKESNIFLSNKYSMVTNFQARYTYGNKSSSGLRIFHWNKSSSQLQNKIIEIRNIISVHKPHILGISEASLGINDNIDLVSINDYSMYLSHPSRSGMIRLVVYVHKDIVVKLRSDMMSPEFCSVWLEVGFKNQKKILVCQAYREWKQLSVHDSDSVLEQLSRWKIFLNTWEQALNTGMETICIGDLNLNHCNWMEKNISKSNQTYKLRHLISILFSKIFPHNVSQFIVGPTRFFPGHTPSGLDHLYSNTPEKICQVQKHFWGESDHMLIGAVRTTKAIKSSPQYIRKRCYKNFNPQQFINAVQYVKWLELYLCEDLDVSVKIFTKKLTEILDVMAPYKTVQIKKSRNPWISNETKDLIKQRDFWQKIASESNCQQSWNIYKKLRNKINNKLKYEEKFYQKVKLQGLRGGSAKSWKIVKNILNWQTSSSPSKLFYKGSLITKAQNVADAQNEFFVTKITKIKEELPNPKSDPLLTLESLMTGRQCSMSLSPIHPDEVLKIIESLSNSTAFGLDGIDTSIIKLAKLELTPAITHIINLSISCSKFPTNWKSSKIVPIHKKDDILNPANYRPIAIIPVVSKI